MYVATTRAAFWLGCSGYWWGEGGTSRLGPSPFLEEVRASGAAQVSAWAPAPEPDAENPLLAEVETADWPRTAAGRHYEAVRQAADMVEAALAEGTPPPAPPALFSGGTHPPGPPLGETDPPSPPLAAGVRRTGLWWWRGAGTQTCCWRSAPSAGAMAPPRWRCPGACRCHPWYRWPATRPS